MGGVVRTISNAVSSVFGGTAQTTVAAPTPTPPAPTPAPNIDAARQSQQAQDAMAGRRGRAATILTSTQGDLTKPTTATKQLLGS